MFGNCYMLQISSGYIEMQRYSRNGGTNDLGSSQLQNIMRRDKSHIELLTNKEKKSIWLSINGKVVKEWTDPAEFNGAGTSLVFSCQPGTYVKISNIKVSKWDGKFDDTSNNAQKSTDDTVLLANEDKLTGHLVSIQDGKAKFSSSYADLEVPLDRIDQMELSTAKSEVAKPSPGDIKACFPDGGSVTMQLLQWDAKACTGTSPNFGKATFSPDAFEKLLFNLQQQQNNSDDDSIPDAANVPDQGND